MPCLASAAVHLPPELHCGPLLKAHLPIALTETTQERKDVTGLLCILLSHPATKSLCKKKKKPSALWEPVLLKILWSFGPCKCQFMFCEHKQANGFFLSNNIIIAFYLFILHGTLNCWTCVSSKIKLKTAWQVSMCLPWRIRKNVVPVLASTTHLSCLEGPSDIIQGERSSQVLSSPGNAMICLTANQV